MELSDMSHGNVWNWSPVALSAALLMAYLYSLFLLKKAGRSWSIWRTVFFTTGMLLMALALSPPLMQHAHQNFEAHMMQHLLLGMLAPLGLVLAAPLTLALNSLPTDAARKVTKILKSQSFHYLSHPVTALLLNIGGMYLLYLTPLYKAMHQTPFIHFLVHLHFILAGYLFVWAIAGPDPAPKRPGLRLRFIVLFVSMAMHAYLSKFMFAHHFPKNTHHTVGEIEAGAYLMYYGGDLAELLLAVAFFSIWYKTRASLRMPLLR